MDIFKLAIILGMVASAVLQAQNPYGRIEQPTMPQAPGQPSYAMPGQQAGFMQAQQGQVQASQAQASQGNPGGLTIQDLQQKGLSPQEAAALLQSYADTANVAAQWLKLLDDGQYGQSWDYASQNFQYTVKKGEWETAEQKLRGPMGRLISRELIQQLPAKDPKGLPRGDYMVLGYKSSFSNRPEVRELVTMIKESDGQWRVLTYQAA